MIRLSGVGKIYQTGKVRFEALKGIDLTIAQGEFVAIVGPSGSGKSTLLNILGLLDTPTSGTYHLAGDEVSGLNDTELAALRNHRLGFVFQSFNLLPRYSIADNVALPMIYAGKSGKERRARAAELLAQLGLGSKIDNLPTELSGGQQQRVALARALANNPDVIIADEPTGNLDSHTGSEIIELFGQLHDQGRTMVVVTHDPRVAEHAKRVVTIQDGMLLSDVRDADVAGAAVLP
ncbi:MAG: macrolide ABC transporter ATP-binding protein [Alphaproteobacteria bacterium CG_4_10_14_0_2_um_filter_63_37]|nr:MAG: macrolide ABC transporter ATP-binding protein [Alphaproteobacteria bacterium CG_4_10_14_0_2_um_filter_63_37]